MKVTFQTQKQRDPDKENGVQVPYGPARKHLPRVRWWLILLVVFSPLLYFLSTLVRDISLIEVPGTITFPSQTYRSIAPGLVENVWVKANDVVAEYQPLVQLLDASLDRQISQLEAEQNTLAVWNENRFSQQSPNSFVDFQLEQARRSLNNQEAHLKSLTRLLEAGAATRGEYLAAEQAMNDALQRVMALHEQQQSQMLRWQNEYRQIAEQRQGYEQRLSDLNNRLSSLYDQRADLSIRSTGAGQVLNVMVVKGEAVGPGTPLLEVGNRDRAEIQVYIPVDDIGYAQLGQQGTVSLTSNRSFRAEIVRLPQTAGRSPGEFSGPFRDRATGILAIMAPLNPMPDQLAVNGIPVVVYFDRHWSFFKPWVQ